MTATIIIHRGATLTGEIKCWLGRRIVEIETPDGARHVGTLRPDHDEDSTVGRLSTVDGAQ